ncbi:MAG TPA: tRNA (adenosine(37)-N6)-threonylcarbamoyltransferase complex ATPase subunit type 1 TsaE [Anaerolineales bacterium]|nr:tRNA (adenosine(37)-N6)-threonylcarbamoyltransferase complex ATPase subunit type 1 TsaE [Anaerolineales bacterium]
MPILEPNAFEFFSRSPDQTRRVGMRLGALLKKGDLVCLDGDLGAGKTTLVQGLANGWGSTDQVSSPTFVLVNLYRRPDGDRFAHLDAYRLMDGAEVIDLDLEALQADGPLVIEWAQKILDSLPEEHLLLKLDWIREEHRQMKFIANGERYEALLETLQKNIYKGT